jgi:hypothetical protein
MAEPNCPIILALIYTDCFDFLPIIPGMKWKESIKSFRKLQYDAIVGACDDFACDDFQNMLKHLQQANAFAFALYIKAKFLQEGIGTKKDVKAAVGTMKQAYQILHDAPPHDHELPAHLLFKSISRWLRNNGENVDAPSDSEPESDSEESDSSGSDSGSESGSDSGSDSDSD